MPKIHYLEPERKTLHGLFDRDLSPAVTIDSGDTVRLRTLDSGWELKNVPNLAHPERNFQNLTKTEIADTL